MRRSSRNSANRKYARVVVIIPFYETQNPFLPFTTTPFGYIYVDWKAHTHKTRRVRSNAHSLFTLQTPKILLTLHATRYRATHFGRKPNGTWSVWRSSIRASLNQRTLQFGTVDRKRDAGWSRDIVSSSSARWVYQRRFCRRSYVNVIRRSVAWASINPPPRPPKWLFVYEPFFKLAT